MRYFVVSWLLFCIGSSIVYAASSQESKDMQSINHEFIGLKEDVKFVIQERGQLLPELKGDTIVLSKMTPVDHPAVLFTLAYLLHYHWMLKVVNDVDICSIVSKSYALRYFSSFSVEEKKKCTQELIKYNEQCASLTQAIQGFCENGLHHKIMKLLISGCDEGLRESLMAASLYAAPTHLLMTQGCDDRLLLDPKTKLNRYFTSPVPCDDIIFRSSSTTSRSSKRGFLQAEKLRQELLVKTLKQSESLVFDNAMQEMRVRIAKVLLNANTDTTSINFFASGTNAEYLPSFLALASHQQWSEQNFVTYKALVTNFVTAETEIGSKSSLAAQMKHISPLLPTGELVKVNTMLNQVPEGLVNVVSLPARNFNNGEVIELSKLEAEIEKEINDLITQHNQKVVLHTVHYAKTGVHMPSYDFACRMKKTYGNDIIVFADAAQTRCSRTLINQYLENDIIVLLTGSKFYSGPSFTGIILIPKTQSKVLEKTTLFVSDGLKNYCNAYDFDHSLVSFRSKLPKWKNVGLLLRLCASISEVEQFFDVPEDDRELLISTWSAQAKSLIESQNDFERVSANSDFKDNIAHTNTVHVFKIVHNNGLFFDMDQLKKIHRWMTLDLSLNLPDVASEQEKKVASIRCLIGQPVKIITQDGRDIGALRLAFGAQTLRAVMQNGFDSEFKNDQTIMSKLHLIKKVFLTFRETIIVS